MRLPQIVKSNGYRELFDEDKLRVGFNRALHKRPVSADLVDDAMERVKQKLLSLGEREVDSRRLGEMVMRELYKLDKVAYIRFASVYRDFQDVEDFRDAVKEVQKPAARRKPASKRMAFSADDFEFMARALRLAERGLYTTTPNPRVGCVLVRDGRIVGEGWHERAGEAHAEVTALNAAGANGRRRNGLCLPRAVHPPWPHAAVHRCADRSEGRACCGGDAGSESAGVRAAESRRLRAAGIAVEAGVLENEARELNIGFVSRMTRGRPWMRVKIAASLDGKTALANGVSQWITAGRMRAATAITGVRVPVR